MGRWAMRAVLLAALVVSSGCATLSQEQCLSADWHALGVSDALAGQSPGQVERHARACAKAGVAPDGGLWRQGYEDGLPQFCVAGRGFELGSRGGSYHDQCPDDLERAFVDAYRAGQDLYDLDQRISEVELEIDRLRDSMNDDEATESSRDADGRWLEHSKNERDRLEAQRWTLQSRARERGYSDGY